MKEKKNERQRNYRARTRNSNTKKYEKTPNGFLMRLYRNMQSRVTGVQKQKFHLYEGKALLDRQVFYEWAKNSHKFYELFEAYKLSNWDRRLCPTVDRIDSSRGYELDNMEWVTLSENARRGSINNPNKLKVEIINNGVSLGEFKSIQEASDVTNFDYFKLYNRAVGIVKNKNPQVNVLP
jgi:hypothetical protein